MPQIITEAVIFIADSNNTLPRFVKPALALPILNHLGRIEAGKNSSSWPHLGLSVTLAQTF
jgi:hypothetical protein